MVSCRSSNIWLSEKRERLRQSILLPVITLWLLRQPSSTNSGISHNQLARFSGLGQLVGLSCASSRAKARTEDCWKSPSEKVPSNAASFSKKRPRREFSDKFKRDAANLVVEMIAAEAVGFGPTILHGWPFGEDVMAARHPLAFAVLWRIRVVDNRRRRLVL